MGGLVPFQPDNEYCVYCHAVAAGPCATCHAMVCGDCCEITGGAVKKVAVCVRCARRGRGTVGWRAWAPIVVPITVGVLLLVLVTALVRAC